MTTLDRITARLSLLLITVAVALWFSQAKTTSILTTPILATPLEVAGPRSDTAEPLVDLNGNEIDIAVGVYRVDARGNVYETHAPEIGSALLLQPRS